MIELEALACKYDSDFYREVASILLTPETNEGISIKKANITVNGVVVNGLRVEVNEESDLDLLTTLRNIIEGVESENRKKGTGDGGDGTEGTGEPDKSDSGEDPSGGKVSSPSDHEPSPIEIVGKQTVH